MLRITRIFCTETKLRKEKEEGDGVCRVVPVYSTCLGCAFIFVTVSY